MSQTSRKAQKPTAAALHLVAPSAPVKKPQGEKTEKKRAKSGPERTSAKKSSPRKPAPPRPTAPTASELAAAKAAAAALRAIKSPTPKLALVKVPQSLAPATIAAEPASLPHPSQPRSQPRSRPASPKLTLVTAPKAEAAGTIAELRAYYHSVHDGERADVITMLGTMGDPAAARELISLYEECEWRHTKLQIIRALAHHPGSRGLELLFRIVRIAQEDNDLPLAETAIWALGQSHSALAARFLAYFYKNCNESLKTSVIGAIGQIPDRALATEFVQALPRALRANQFALVRNLVLTLGELKVREALPLIQSLAADPQQPTLALSALVSLGKMGREPKDFDALERRFQGDLFEYQLFTSARTQVQFRAQWKLEDYLSRIFEFEDPTFHRALPFELMHFAAEDVREGLKLFAGARHLPSLCRALAKLDFADVANWYAELIDFDALDPEGVRCVLESIGEHFSASMREPLTLLAHHPACAQGPGLSAWLQAVAMALPEADNEFRDFFAGDRYRALDDAQRIAAINHLIEFGLTAQTHGARLQGVARILESLLDAGSPVVQARALRGLGHLRFVSKKAQMLARESFNHSVLAGSALRYFELCPDKAPLTLPSALFAPSNSTPSPLLAAALRCWAAQPTLTSTDPILRMALEQSFSTCHVGARLEALRLLGRHPLGPWLAAVVAALGHPDARVVLAAIIALKSFAISAGAQIAGALDDGQTVNILAPLLRSPQQSIAGRALDTLTAMSSLRAQRVVIDFLRERETDGDVCDKIIRCLAPPATGAEYFATIIDGILQRHPAHPQLDGLLSLRERITERTAASPNSPQLVKGADITHLDRILSQRVAGYDELDESVRSALRSAELPYLHPEMFDDYVDKSGSVVEYCKAIDLHLEKTLGKRHLFNKLENQLHEFQSALHAASLNEDAPAADRVIRQMGLEKHFNAQSLPLHKMVTLAQGIRNGRVVNDRFKILDGLRAWAVVLLLFSRRFAGQRPLVPIRDATDDQIAVFCKRLIALQEVRNPAAHRQTVSKLALIDETRAEVLALFNQMQKYF